MLKARASSSISSLQSSSILTLASSSPWPKAVAVLASSFRGLLSRRAKAMTPSTAMRTTNTETVRKILEILFRTCFVPAVGVDTMTMPSLLSPLTMGADTT